MKPGIFKHINCRNSLYPGCKIQRFTVPDEFVFWNNDFPEYKPSFYESAAIKGKIWADPDIDDVKFSPKWNIQDGQVNRTSHISEYKIENNYPENPFGRTGIIGRGLLGRWGPNHAADPVVTRWKKDLKDQPMVGCSGKKILQMIAIERRDNKMWAIPGGMVDGDEKVSQTLKREFTEEALNSAGLSQTLDAFFKNGTEIYAGYVDDPRNTDNAWMETVAYNFHDDTGVAVGKLTLEAGDDAGNVKWMDINQHIHLYASHKLFIEKIVQRLNAHW